MPDGPLVPASLLNTGKKHLKYGPVYQPYLSHRRYPEREINGIYTGQSMPVMGPNLQRISVAFESSVLRNSVSSACVYALCVLNLLRAFKYGKRVIQTVSVSRMSAEPHRKKAYSSDLRWRIVYQRIGMGLSFPKIASNLNVALRGFSLYLSTLEQLTLLPEKVELK